MNQARFSNKDSEISWQKIPHEDPTNCSWNLTRMKTYMRYLHYERSMNKRWKQIHFQRTLNMTIKSKFSTTCSDQISDTRRDLSTYSSWEFYNSTSDMDHSDNRTLRVIYVKPVYRTSPEALIYQGPYLKANLTFRLNLESASIVDPLCKMSG